ncbi:tetratricopeptide repeat protein [Nitrospirillum pindoramense]|uniref:Tetratricopeptide (TPR) repeat protein n=1 Tax=Nitrospirillum amazonense TaxID=28077 RepID=A0A560H4A3_9PROT|nr:tetratricopeptide repeat protein [Nitrospirillum amazonense]TWB40544.1 tetratricopeptide (TPR) repeat protein [Nitrospirillum amazonense]
MTTSAPKPCFPALRVPVRRLLTHRSLILGAALMLALAVSPTWAAPQEVKEPPADAAAAALSAVALPTVTVRAGEHPGRSRLVFDWPTPVKATLERDGAKLLIHFDKPAKADLAAPRRAGSPRISRVETVAGTPGLTVALTIPANATVEQSRSGDKVVIDVGDGKPGAPPVAASTTTSTPPAAPPAAKPEAPKEGKAPPAASTLPPAAGAGEPPSVAAAPADPRAAKEGRPLYLLQQQPPTDAKGTKDAKAPAAKEPPTKEPAGKEPGKEIPGKDIKEAQAKPTPSSAHPNAPDTKAAPHGAPAAEAAPPGAEAGQPAEGAPAAPAPSLVFDPGQPSAVAVFARAGWLYVLFDRPVPATTAPAAPQGGPADESAFLGQVEPVALPGGGGFRLPAPAVLEPRVTGEGPTGYRITFDHALAMPSEGTPAGVPVTTDPDFALGPRLVVKTAKPAKVFTFTDPVVGDTLKVVPLSPAPQRTPAPLRYAEAQFLPTAQGVVIRPIDERLLVQPAKEGVELTVPGGLRLSPSTDVAVAAPPPPVVEPDRFFDFQRWAKVDPNGFIAGRQRLMNEITKAPPDDRPKLRLDLARFYAGNGFGQEALGLLEMARKDQPDLEKRAEFAAVRGTARILTGDAKGGLDDLTAPALQNEPDVALWRAYAAHTTGDDDTAYRLFQSRKELLRTYPEPFNTRFGLAAAEAALAKDDVGTANGLLDRLVKRGATKGPAETAVNYLRGEAAHLEGDHEKAIESYREATEGPDRLYRTKARMALVDEELAAGKLTPAKAAEQMEKMRFAWTGDDLELHILRRLADLHIKAGNFPQAFDTMKRAITLFPNSPEAPLITKQMTDTFTGLFVRNGADKMPPLEALSLYEQYKELTPPGPDGDTVIRVLAERLVDVDLLDRAAELLDRQVQYRLQGEQKAQVGTREAAIRLLNNQPDKALAALDQSEVAGIPDAMAAERRLLRARALSRTDKGPEAVALLKQDNSRPANLLRIDIAWHAKQWPLAAQALADVIGPPPAAGQPIDPTISRLVVNRAVALSLAQDMPGLQKLRTDFGPSMDKGPDANMFQVMTRPNEATGLLDATTIQNQVKEIDLFKSFLDSYRTRQSQGAAVPGDASAAGGEAPPSATAPPESAKPAGEPPTASSAAATPPAPEGQRR